MKGKILGAERQDSSRHWEDLKKSPVMKDVLLDAAVLLGWLSEQTRKLLKRATLRRL